MAQLWSIGSATMVRRRVFGGMISGAKLSFLPTLWQRSISQISAESLAAIPWLSHNKLPVLMKIVNQHGPHDKSTWHAMTARAYAIMNSLTPHDVDRILTALGNENFRDAAFLEKLQTSRIKDMIPRFPGSAAARVAAMLSKLDFYSRDIHGLLAKRILEVINELDTSQTILTMNGYKEAYVREDVRRYLELYAALITHYPIARGQKTPKGLVSLIGSVPPTPETAKMLERANILKKVLELLPKFGTSYLVRLFISLCRLCCSSYDSKVHLSTRLIYQEVINLIAEEFMKTSMSRLPVVNLLRAANEVKNEDLFLFKNMLIREITDRLSSLNVWEIINALELCSGLSSPNDPIVAAKVAKKIRSLPVAPNDLVPLLQIAAGNASPELKRAVAASILKIRSRLELSLITRCVGDFELLDLEHDAAIQMDKSLSTWSGSQEDMPALAYIRDIVKCVNVFSTFGVRLSSSQKLHSFISSLIHMSEKPAEDEVQHTSEWAEKLLWCKVPDRGLVVLSSATLQLYLQKTDGLSDIETSSSVRRWYDQAVEQS